MGLKPNTLAFIGLCNEYCQLLEKSGETESTAFVAEVLRLLPRIYISASDLDVTSIDEDFPPVDSVLDEEYYETIRRNIETLLGPDDAYLEVFEKEMKYSDTPIGASVAEGLSDLFQVFYNFIATMRYADESVIEGVLVGVKEDFAEYWSQILVNLLRPLNDIRYHILDNEEND